MSRTRKTIALLLSLTLLLGVFAGCTTPAQRAEESATAAPSGDDAQPAGSDDSAGAPAGGKTLRFSQLVEPATVDPQLANASAVQVICAHLFEPLMRSHGGTVSPGAAERYEMSDDGLVYTFYLRDGLVWSDGEPLTAAHYEYGMKRLMDPATASEYAFFGEVLKNGSAVNAGELAVDELGVRALDDKTVEITLEYPASYFLGMLITTNFAATRPDLVEQYGTDFANTAEQNVYSGPFVIKEWRKNDRVILEKNPNYWDAANVNLDTVEILTVADRNTVSAMYDSGDLDYAEINPILVDQYPDARFYYNGANDYLKLNHASGVLGNKNLRLALNYGISRKDFIKLTTNDVYEANQRFVLPQVAGVSGEYGTEYPYQPFPLEADLDAAKEYLDAALGELGLSDPAEVVIELLMSDDENSRTQAEVIQSQYQSNLGITINIRQVPYRQRLDMEAARDYQMVFTGWMPDYSDPYTYLELWATNSPYNHASYNSAAYDDYLQRATYETDPKARLDLLFEAEKTFCEDAVVVPLQLRREAYMESDKVNGFIHYFVGLNHDFVNADIVG